jgi:hypothetical protein
MRIVLDAVTIGITAAAAGALWLARSGRPSWPSLATLPLVMTAGLGVALKRRWSDTDVALFLDARSGSEEAITTALGTRADADVAARVERDALRALAAFPRRAAPRILFPRHGVVLLAAAVVALAPRVIPVRPVPAPVRAPTVARVHLEPQALARVEALRELSAKSAEERARLEALAEQARKLDARNAAGIERRAALDGLGRLREGVDRERLAARTSAAGREAAARALAQSAETEKAAEAVRRMDLVALDREMDRLARSLEARSRKIAREALDQAHEAARAKGDDALADALDEQRRLLKRRAERSQALKELSRLLDGALPKDVKRKLSRLDRESADGAEALADALANALEGLTAEERQRLAKSLAEQAFAGQNARALTKEELDRLVKELTSPAGRDALRRQLEALARGEASEAGERERALALAELAVADAAASITGQGGGNGASAGSGAPDRGGGQGAHTGASSEVGASSFAARADGRPTGGIPIGEVPGVSAAVPVARSVRSRAVALEAAAPREVGAVEHSNVPREYRDQVGRYFAP